MTNILDRAEKIAAKIIKAVADKEEIAEYEKNLRAKLAELVDNGSTFAGEFKISRRENVRFDAASAKKNLTAEELERISVMKPEAARAKALLEENRLALCQKTYDPVVQVEVRND